MTQKVWAYSLVSWFHSHAKLFSPPCLRNLQKLTGTITETTFDNLLLNSKWKVLCPHKMLKGPLIGRMALGVCPDSVTVSDLAAKSLQSCPTLCDPIPGILQARTLEWVAISFSNAWKWKVKVKLLSCVWFLVTPWTAAYQAPPSMGFSRREYWSGVPLFYPFIFC